MIGWRGIGLTQPSACYDERYPVRFAGGAGQPEADLEFLFGEGDVPGELHHHGCFKLVLCLEKPHDLVER